MDPDGVVHDPSDPPPSLRTPLIGCDRDAAANIIRTKTAFVSFRPLVHLFCFHLHCNDAVLRCTLVVITLFLSGWTPFCAPFLQSGIRAVCRLDDLCTLAGERSDRVCQSSTVPKFWPACPNHCASVLADALTQSGLPDSSSLCAVRCGSADSVGARTWRRSVRGHVRVGGFSRALIAVSRGISCAE